MIFISYLYSGYSYSLVCDRFWCISKKHFSLKTWLDLWHKKEICVFVPFSCSSHLGVGGVLVKKLVGVEEYLGYTIVQELGSVDPISEAFV